MPDFLTKLAQRSLGTAPLVQPRLPSLFASGGRGAVPISSNPLSSAIPDGPDLPGRREIVDIGIPGIEASPAAESRSGRANAAIHPAPSLGQASAKDEVGESTPTGRASAAGRPRKESNRSERSTSPRLSPLLPSSGKSIGESNREVETGSTEGRERRAERVRENGNERREDAGLPLPENRTESEKGRGASQSGDRNRTEENLRNAGPRLIPFVQSEMSGREEARGSAVGGMESNGGENPFESTAPQLSIERRLPSESRADRRGDFTESISVPQSLLPRMPDREVEPERIVESVEGDSSQRESGRLLLPGHVSQNVFEGMIAPPPVSPDAERSSSRTINVTIGRIEVRGTPDRKMERPSPRRSPEKPSSPSPAMSLDDYLKRYNRKGE